MAIDLEALARIAHLLQSVETVVRAALTPGQYVTLALSLLEQCEGTSTKVERMVHEAVIALDELNSEGWKAIRGTTDDPPKLEEDNPAGLELVHSTEPEPVPSLAHMVAEADQLMRAVAAGGPVDAIGARRLARGWLACSEGTAALEVLRNDPIPCSRLVDLCRHILACR